MSQAWDMSIGPAFGVAGSRQTLTVTPQCLFRVEKVMANDTGAPAGYGTRILQFIVGQRLQRPNANGSPLALFFGPATLGNGMRWDTCQRGLTISVQVEFVQSCTFDMALFGQAVT